MPCFQLRASASGRGPCHSCTRGAASSWLRVPCCTAHVFGHIWGSLRARPPPSAGIYHDTARVRQIDTHMGSWVMLARVDTQLRCGARAQNTHFLGTAVNSKEHRYPASTARHNREPRPSLPAAWKRFDTLVLPQTSPALADQPPCRMAAIMTHVRSSAGVRCHTHWFCTTGGVVMRDCAVGGVPLPAAPSRQALLQPLGIDRRAIARPGNDWHCSGPRGALPQLCLRSACPRRAPRGPPHPAARHHSTRACQCHTMRVLASGWRPTVTLGRLCGASWTATLRP